MLDVTPTPLAPRLPAHGSPSIVDEVAPPAPPEVLIRRYTRVRGLILATILVVLAVFGGFFTWSATASLARGTHASGTVSVESSRKTIQHLEGGIIRALHVREGSRVAAGDVLVEIDDTRARATVSIARNQLDSALAQRARLIAQRDDLSAIAFPEELLARQTDDPELAAILASHRAAFDSEIRSFRGLISIYEEQIHLMEREIERLNAQNQANQRQIRLIEQEIQDVRYLVERNLERRPRLLALQREAADLAGEIEGNNAMILRAGSSIAERQLQINQSRINRFEQAVSQLQTVQDRIADLQARLVAEADALRRTAIVAPQNGTVVNLRFHTLGGVVQPGVPILDLVPEDDTLILVVRVSPRDADNVHPGLEAEVKFSGLNARTTPILFGSVTHVSADALQDQPGSEPYFEARVTVPASELDRLSTNITIVPGMPVEVAIMAGHRTPLEFLLQPLRDSAWRGFIAE